MALVVLGIVLVIGGIAVLASRMKVAPTLQRLGGVLALVVGGAAALGSAVIVIDAGEIGVVVVFGQVRPTALGSGIHAVPPYAAVVRYPVRLIEYTMEDANQIEARSSNGLGVFLDCTTLFSINPEMAADIYSRVAPSVEQLGSSIFTPIVRTVLRNTVSRYTSEELYSSKREEVQAVVGRELATLVEPKGILVDQFLIRAIRLPADVDQAIQAKIAAQQEAEAMTYRREKAEREAEIRVIEARGLAESQKIINSTLTQNYLQHEAIQAYRELASKPNATFVIMPTSPEATGMPLILGSGR